MSAKRIARRLQRRIDQPLEVTLTDNVSRMLSVSRRNGILRVRLHHMFTHAGMRTLHAVTRYIKTGGEEGRETIREFVSNHGDKIRDRTRRVTITTRGEHFDLEALRDEVYAEHFSGQDPPHITWSRTTRGKNKRSIQFGSFDPGKDLVRINPKLDAPFVPDYYMKYLIFHEILHREFPPRPGDVHTREYQEALRQFPHYERATQWEEKNLHRFVRSAEKKR